MLLNRMWVRISLVIAICILIGPMAIGYTTIISARPDSLVEAIREQASLRGGLISRLAQHYREEGTWEGIGELVAQSVPMTATGFNGAGITLSLLNPDGRVIFDMNEDVIGQYVETISPDALPIEIADRVAGYLLINASSLPDPAQVPGIGDIQLTNFIRLVTAAIVVTSIVSLIGGIVLSRTLAAPLGDLARVAREFGSNHPGIRAKVRGSEEMREVARAFNEMADAIEQGQQLRRNLTADIAHELRTPLTVVQANLQAILDDVYPLDKEEIRRIFDQTELLAHLVGDLRLLAQVESGSLVLQRQAVDLRELLSIVVDKFEPVAAAQQITLESDLTAGAVIADADPSRIQQVLHNLIQNALTHTPAEGKVSASLRQDGASAVIDIRDTGAGINPQQLPLIFERFYRADPSRSRDTGGSGLGLAIVRAIVEMHGGQVSAASEGIPGKGSTFSIRLPLPGTIR